MVLLAGGRAEAREHMGRVSCLRSLWACGQPRCAVGRAIYGLGTRIGPDGQAGVWAASLAGPCDAGELSPTPGANLTVVKAL